MTPLEDINQYEWKPTKSNSERERERREAPTSKQTIETRGQESK